MTDMPSDFWGGWITVLTLVSLAGLAWLIFSAYFSKSEEPANHEEPVWDENLREGSNPAPMWWFWLILSAMIFSVIYFMLYPALGSFQGMLKWSQGGRVAQSQVLYEEEFAGLRNTIADARLETLQSDARFMSSAGRIYDRNCAVCHGYDAAGQAKLFPNLTDDIWQWGGTPEQIESTIRQGRRPVMVGWQAVLGDEGIDDVVDYVLTLGSGGAEASPGHAKYQQFCVACHSVDGSGNQALGAPSLVDDDWLYGSTPDDVRLTIAQGRKGIMPAFQTRLDDAQTRLLVAWLTRPAD